jgi:hypothetical protein
MVFGQENPEIPYLSALLAVLDIRQIPDIPQRNFIPILEQIAKDFEKSVDIIYIVENFDSKI